MIFRWHPNSAWNPREWITKRLSMRQKGMFWEDEELLEKAHRIANPHIERRKRGNEVLLTPKTLQDELSYLFDENVRSDRESHILCLMVLIYIHTELENNSTWSLPPLYSQEWMSSVFNFIYHLSNDLGKCLCNEGTSPKRTLTSPV